VFQWTSE
jgi:hypothetical protein